MSVYLSRLVPVWRVALAGLLALSYLFGPVGPAKAQQGNTLYVNAAAPADGDGSSWEKAFRSLQSALAAAQPEDSIWVAAGTYRPGDAQDADAKHLTFHIPYWVRVIGGFAGGETLPTQARPERNIVTLTCDLLGDDGPDGANRSDNCYHTVTMSEMTTLGGVTVTGGNAVGATVPDDRGGGVYVPADVRLATLQRVTLRDNIAEFGGGVFIGPVSGGAGIILGQVLFVLNFALQYGGGVYTEGEEVTIDRGIMEFNQAAVSGGAIYLAGGSLRAGSLAIVDNDAETGSGIYQAAGTAHLEHLSLTTNTAYERAALYHNGGQMVVSNSIFWDNDGGEIEDANPDDAFTVSHSNVMGGYPGTANLDVDPRAYDGYLRLLSDSPMIGQGDTSQIRYSYDADGRNRMKDGRVDIGAFEWQRLYVDQYASGADNGSSWDDAYTELDDALFDAHTSDEIWVAQGTYTPTEPSQWDDPRSRTFQLKPEVFLFGGFAGGETSWEERDPEENTTVLSGDLSGDDDGTPAAMAENAYHVVTLASEATLDGFSIQFGNADGPGSHALGGGVYGDHVQFCQLQNLDISVNRATDGGGGLYLANDQGCAAENLAFGGNQTPGLGGGILTYDSDLNLFGGEWINNRANLGGGWYIDASDSRPAGPGSGVFLAEAAFVSNIAEANGGGLYVHAANPTVLASTFYANQADLGGGLYAHQSAPQMMDVIFAGNLAESDGGGAYLDSHDSTSDAAPTLEQVWFIQNNAQERGGALFNTDASPYLGDITFQENFANDGAAIYALQGSLAVHNASFLSNAAVQNGGGLVTDNASAVLDFSTFHNNTAQAGGALYNAGGGQARVSAGILWDNPGGQVVNYPDGAAQVEHSIVQGGYAGVGNLDADPLLAAPQQLDDVLLQVAPLLPGSPALDVITTGCPDADARGKDRDDGACDLGAFESSGFTLAVVAGDEQTAMRGQVFAHALEVSVTPNHDEEPVDGGVVRFTVTPNNGAGATLSTQTAIIANDKAGVRATANNQIGGPYRVQAQTAGAAEAAFSLTNVWFEFMQILPLIVR